jgi:hypothetical protein
MYRCLLLSSGTVKMDYEENVENARYAMNDDTPLWTKDWIILCCCIKSVTVLLCLYWSVIMECQDWSSDTVIDLIVEGRNRRVVLIRIIT